MDNFNSLIKLSAQHSLYEKFREAYREIYNDNTGTEGERVKFLGGQPTTLTNDYITSLTVEDHYYVSPKLDGERMLLLAIRDVEEFNLGSVIVDDTKFCLIDRELNFYVPQARDGSFLHDKNHIAGKINEQFTSSWNNDQMISKTLIDGELLILGVDGKFYKNHNQVGRENVERYVYFAFDIMYGPTVINAKIQYDMYMHEYGNFSSMQGPRIMGRIIKGEGGKDERGWSYERRHNQLTKFVRSDNKLNKELQMLSPLCRYFHEYVKWFIIMSKPVYDLRKISIDYCIEKNRKISFQNFVISVYKKDIINEIKYIKSKIGESAISKYFNVKNLIFDGIIFTPKHGEYKSGPAIAPMNTTFKYKEEATIDLIMKNGKLCGREGKNKFIEINDIIPIGISEGEVAEFRFLENRGEWIISEMRPDKVKPNSIHVINNVIRSIKDPVNLKNIAKIIHWTSLSEDEKEKYKASMINIIVDTHLRRELRENVIVNPFFLFSNNYILEQYNIQEHELGENQFIKMNLSNDQMETIALMFKRTFDSETKYFKCDNDKFVTREEGGKEYKETEIINKRIVSRNNKLRVRGNPVYIEVKPDYDTKREIAFDIISETKNISIMHNKKFKKNKYIEYNILENHIFKLQKIYTYKPFKGKAKRDKIINEMIMVNYDLFTLYKIFYYLSIY